MEFLKTHWGWIASIGIPVLITILASIANRFKDPDNNPDTPPPKWVQAFWVVIDVLSWVAKPGQVGVAGSVSVPGVKSKPDA